MYRGNVSNRIARIVSAVLAAALIFAALPAAAHAQGNPTGSIVIQCRNSAGSAVPGVALALYADEALTAQAGAGTSDASGSVRFAGLGTAKYWLAVKGVPDGYELTDARIPFSAVDGKETGYTLILPYTGIEDESDDIGLLKSISASGELTPSFSPETKKYTLALGERTATATIRATAPSGSSITIGGKRVGSVTVKLNPGAKKTVQIRVKPAGGASVLYTVTVTRAKSTDASLKGIAASSGTLSPSFAGGTAAYTLTLPKRQCWVRVVPKLSGKYAAYTATLDGRRLRGTALSVPYGKARKLVIRVRAQSGKTRTYTVVIQRAR